MLDHRDDVASGGTAAKKDLLANVDAESIAPAAAWTWTASVNAAREPDAAPRDLGLNRDGAGALDQIGEARAGRVHARPGGSIPMRCGKMRSGPKSRPMSVQIADEASVREGFGKAEGSLPEARSITSSGSSGPTLAAICRNSHRASASHSCSPFSRQTIARSKRRVSRSR